MMNKRIRASVSVFAFLVIFLNMCCNSSLDNSLYCDSGDTINCGTSDNCISIMDDVLVIENCSISCLDLSNTIPNDIYKICFIDCDKLNDIQSISIFNAVKVIEFNNCESLQDISVISSFDELAVLSISNCPNIDYSTMPFLKSIHEIHIHNSNKIIDEEIFLQYKDTGLSCLTFDNVINDVQLERIRKVLDTVSVIDVGKDE